MLFRATRARKRLERLCEQLLDATREASGWRWDESNGVVLATIDAPQRSALLERLRELFPHSWDQLDIATAPRRVRYIAGLWGGLMAGQHLFVLDAEGDPVLFALWMPWSDRIHTSLRVGCTPFAAAAAKWDPRGALRAFMGLEPRVNGHGVSPTR